MPTLQLPQDTRWGDLGQGLGGLLGAVVTAVQAKRTAQGVAQIDQDESIAPHAKYDAILKQWGPQGITIYNQMLTSQRVASQIAMDEASAALERARLPGEVARGTKAEVEARTAQLTEPLAVRAALANIAEKEASGQLTRAQADEARARLPLIGGQVAETGARASLTQTQALLNQQEALRNWALENERRINMGQPPQDPSTMPQIGLPVPPAGPALGVKQPPDQAAAAPVVPFPAQGGGAKVPAPYAPTGPLVPPTVAGPGAPPAGTPPATGAGIPPPRGPSVGAPGVGVPTATGGGVPATSAAPAPAPGETPAAPPAGTAPPDEARPTPLDMMLDNESKLIPGGLSEEARLSAKQRYNSAEQEKPGSGYKAVLSYLDKFKVTKEKPAREQDTVFAGKTSSMLSDLEGVVNQIERDPGAGGGLLNTPRAYLEKHGLIREQTGLMERASDADQLVSSYVQQRGGFGGNWLLNFAKSITPGGTQHGPIYSMMAAKAMAQKAIDEAESRRSGYSPEMQSAPLDRLIAKAQKLKSKLDTFWGVDPLPRLPAASASAAGGATAGIPSTSSAAEDALRYQLYQKLGIDPTQQHVYYKGNEINPATFKVVRPNVEFPEGAVMRTPNGKTYGGGDINAYARNAGIDPQVVWEMMKVKSAAGPGVRSAEQPVALPPQ